MNTPVADLLPESCTRSVPFGSSTSIRATIALVNSLGTGSRA